MKIKRLNETVIGGNEYYIKFKHVIEETWTAVVNADTEEEAIEMFEDDPYEYVDDEQPEDSQGLEIKIIGVEESELND